MKRLVKVCVLLLCVCLGLTALTACGGAAFDPEKNIVVITREDGSGTKDAIKELVGAKGVADPVEIVRQSSTAAVLSKVSSDPQAIGYDSYGYTKGNSSVKMLTVEGKEITADNIKNGSYVLARPFNVLYKEETIDNNHPAQKAFYEFLQSSQAQTLITEGYVPVKDNAAAYIKKNVSVPSGKITLWGSTSVQPLMTKLASKFCEIEGWTLANGFNIGGPGSSAAYTDDGANSVGKFGMISSEPAANDFMNADKGGGKALHLCQDGIAIIVHPSNTYDNITKDQLKRIFTQQENQLTVWKNLG